MGCTRLAGAGVHLAPLSGDVCAVVARVLDHLRLHPAAEDPAEWAGDGGGGYEKWRRGGEGGEGGEREEREGGQRLKGRLKGGRDRKGREGLWETRLEQKNECANVAQRFFGGKNELAVEELVQRLPSLPPSLPLSPSLLSPPSLSLSAALSLSLPPPSLSFKWRRWRRALCARRAARRRCQRRA